MVPIVAIALGVALALGGAEQWRSHAALPVPRTEGLGGIQVAHLRQEVRP